MTFRLPVLPYIKQRSLQQRVIGLVSLIMLSATLFVVIVFSFYIYRTERNAWQSRQRDAAHSASHTVETFVNQVQDYLILVGLADQSFLDQNSQLLPRLLAQYPALSEVARLDHEGQLLAGAHQPDETPVLNNLFTIPQSSWFLQAREGKRYVGQVQISAANKPYLILSMPSQDNGVVAARLRMDVLWQIVADIHFGETGHTYVVNQRGDVVAHANTQFVLDRTNILDQPIIAAALAAPDHKWDGAYTNFEGVAVIGSTLPIEIGDWIVITEVSQSETYATTRRALVVLGGGILLLSVFIVVATSYWLNTLILWPMAALRDGAEHIGRGNWDYSLDADRPDEIGRVATAFNQMALNLKDREQALAQARDDALAANRLKSRILANVSHDLRTPLNAIMGHSEMLLKGIYGPLSEKQQRIGQRVLTNTRNLTGMVSKLMEQARLETGSLKLECAPFSPTALIDDLHSAMGVLAGETGGQLSAHVEPDLPATLHGDYNWLYQILANLVENALKFTEQGETRVRLYRPDESHWAMQVSDTGPGIPTAAQEVIFEPFRQVDGTTTRTHKGSGLGLSIVKQVTEQMGGQVLLESQPGQGSTFTILLPLAPAQETTA